MSCARVRKPTDQIAIFSLALLGLAGQLLMASADAQTFTAIKSLGDSNSVSGSRPICQLVQGPDGTLYGTTSSGQINVLGTVFKVQPDGSDFTVLKCFTNSIEGKYPTAGLTLSGNVLYGVTASGGTWDNGTVFQINTDGTGFTVLKHFDYTNGSLPYATLTLFGGTLYGTTYDGGAAGTVGYGTLFKVNTDGTGYTVLKRFCCSAGENPVADLTLSGSTLYGTTYSGGSQYAGTVFKVNTDGSGYGMLKDFPRLFASDGKYPATGLLLSGSLLYGTTTQGGSSDAGTVYRMNTDGTGYTVLKHFTGSDGSNPRGRLTLSGSTLYGTTYYGGNSDCGTVFKLNTDGTGFTVLKHFTGSDGRNSYGGVILSGSTLYGTTYYGGNFDLGAVFKLELPIPLNIQPVINGIILNWTDPAYGLQAAPEVDSVYTNIPGALSPFTLPATGPQQFFRLIKN